MVAEPGLEHMARAAFKGRELGQAGKNGSGFVIKGAVALDGKMMTVAIQSEVTERYPGRVKELKQFRVLRACSLNVTIPFKSLAAQNRLADSETANRQVRPMEDLDALKVVVARGNNERFTIGDQRERCLQYLRVMFSLRTVEGEPGSLPESFATISQHFPSNIVFRNVACIQNSCAGQPQPQNWERKQAAAVRRDIGVKVFRPVQIFPQPQVADNGFDA